MSTSPVYRVLDFLVYSHVFIGICAGCLCLETFSILRIGPSRPLLLFIYAAAAALYSTHRLFQSEVYRTVADRRIVQLWERRSLLHLSLVLHGLLAAYLFFFHLADHWQAFLVPILLGTLYVIPYRRDLRRLRDLPYLKIFLITLCWVWVTLILPVRYSGESGDPWMWWLALERFLFIFAITLPFDIRDLAIDSDLKIKTIANSIGEKNSKLLSYSIFIVTTILGFIYWRVGFFGWPVTATLTVTYALSFILTARARPHSSPVYYAVLLDGMMIVHGLLVTAATA